MASTFNTEGVQFLLELANGEQTKPATYYIGLCTDLTVALNASVATLTELAGNGYARQPVTGDSVSLVSAGHGTYGRKLTTATVTFTAAGGDWVNAARAFLTTTLVGTTGPLIGTYELDSGSGRQADDGESFDTDMQLQLTPE